MRNDDTTRCVFAFLGFWRHNTLVLSNYDKIGGVDQIHPKELLLWAVGPFCAPLEWTM